GVRDARAKGRGEHLPLERTQGANSPGGAPNSFLSQGASACLGRGVEGPRGRVPTYNKGSNSYLDNIGDIQRHVIDSSRPYWRIRGLHECARRHHERRQRKQQTPPRNVERFVHNVSSFCVKCPMLGRPMNDVKFSFEMTE